MKSQSFRFTSQKLIEILSLSQNATAIYTGEEITIQTANDVMIGFWGKNRDVIGKPLAEAVPELTGHSFIAQLQEVWRTGITYETKDAIFEFRVDGILKTFYFDYIYRAIRNEAGEVDCILHTATNVTELNLGRNLINRAKEQQDALDREQSLNEELGATVEELTAANEELASALEELSTTNEELLYAQNSLKVLNEQLEVRVDERTARIAELNQELAAANEELMAANEELAAANEELVTTNEELHVSRDNLERSVIDLESSEYKTRSIIESAPFPIGVYTGREMRIAFANQSITDVWGKGNDVIGKLYSDILPELDNQAVFDQLDHVYITGIPFEARNQQIDLFVNGKLQPYYFNYSFTALKNEQGEVYGVMNTAAEVTDVVLAKQEVEKYAVELSSLNEALKISQDELNLAITAAGLGTFNLDPSTGRFKGNDLLKLWFGLEPKDDIKLTAATDVIAEADRDRVTAAIQHALDYSSGGDYDTSYTIINPLNPEPKIVRAKGKVLFNADQQPIRLSGVLQDVTEQVNSRQEIVDINTRLNIAIDAGGLGSTEVDLATGTMECNAQFKRCFGRSRDDDFNYPDLFEAMLPQYREKIRALVTIAKENHSVYKAEYEVAWPDGSIHWINAHGQARYDSDGNAVKMVGIISDVTETKKDEQRKNDFIAMVSHELKTPLTSLAAYVQLLHRKAKTNSDSFAAGALDKANNQVKKMTTMINGFLNVSRLESGKIHIDNQRFDMTELITEVQQEFIATVSTHQVIFTSPGHLFIDADRDKIGQVINNFISNAIKYSPATGAINVSCKTIDDQLVVAVTDEGRGINEDDQQRLFERYYRVKDQPVNIAGFGIGLYLCAEVIHRHNGKIWLESEIGKGSTFYFSLPA